LAKIFPDFVVRMKINASRVWWCYPTPSEGWGGDSMETQQSGHAPRSGPEVKNESSAKDGAPERLGCGTVKKVSQILQRVSAGAK